MFRSKSRFLAGMFWISLSSIAKAQDPVPKNHKWAECEESLHSAKSPKPVVVVQAARCFMNLGVYTRAAQILTKHIDEMDAQGAQGGRAAIEGLLQTALSHVAVLDVKSEHGAVLHIDGTLMGKFPAANPVFLDPGEHLIEARIDHRRVQKRIEVVANYMGSVELPFPQTNVGKHPENSPFEPATQRQPTKSAWSAGRIAIIASGAIVGVTGTGIGVANVLSRQNAEQQRAAIVDGFPLRTSQCAQNANSNDCVRVAEWVEKRDNATRLSWGGFIGGAVGLAAATTAVIWPGRRGSSSQDTGHVAAAIVPTSGGATVWLGGTF